jgi:hypothetical protein
MSSERPTQIGNPTAAQITDYITSAYSGVFIARAFGGTFFSLNEQSWPNFATVVETDENDDASNLSARGAFRLNIGVLPQTFKSIVDPGASYDYTAEDVLMPHPVYAAQRWICIVNPSRATFDAKVKPLLDEAYAKLARSTIR